MNEGYLTDSYVGETGMLTIHCGMSHAIHIYSQMQHYEGLAACYSSSAATTWRCHSLPSSQHFAPSPQANYTQVDNIFCSDELLVDTRTDGSM